MSPDSTSTPRPPYLDDHGGPRAFVIVSSARSGSNLLVAYLRQIARAACFGEIFRGEFPAKPGWAKLAARLDLPPDAGGLHRSDLRAFWDLVLGRALRRRRWAGAKVFYYHRESDPVWDRFGDADHRVIHLWRDATLDQYVSRRLAVESGEWKAGDGTAEPRVRFDVDDYRRYRAGLRAGFERTRERFGGSDHYVELEYRQLSEHVLVEDLLERLFGQRISVAETLRRQRDRPKLEYLVNPDAAAPYARDSLSGGYDAE